jgi:hypothetical protein
VLGAKEAVVRGIEPYAVHGSPHVRVALSLDSGEMIQAQLGAESVPADLTAGERVVVRFAMNVVVAIERPAPSS